LKYGKGVFLYDTEQKHWQDISPRLIISPNYNSIDDACFEDESMKSHSVGSSGYMDYEEDDTVEGEEWEDFGDEDMPPMRSLEGRTGKERRGEERRHCNIL
jgi:hypothetical protein